MSKLDPRISISGARPPLHRRQICIPLAPLLRNPDPLSPLDSQLVFGAGFDVFEEDGEFSWGQEIQLSGDGYVGYVPTAALIQSDDPPTHRIKTLWAPVFTNPDLKSPIRMKLPLNASICLQSQDGQYYQAPGLGYLHQNHVCELTSSDGDYVSWAEQHYGLPYIWGGLSSDGLDCSGLVQSALRAVGRNAPRDSDLQEKMPGQAIDQSAPLKRGDLVFWQGHVGIMTDTETLLHANAYHMCVEREPLNEATRRIAKTAGPITSIKRLDLG